MIIHPFLAGVLCTLFIEMALVIGYALTHRKEKNDGTGSDNSN